MKTKNTYIEKVFQFELSFYFTFKDITHTPTHKQTHRPTTHIHSTLAANAKLCLLLREEKPPLTHYTRTHSPTLKIRNRKPSNKKPTEAISENEMKNHEWPTSRREGERVKGVQRAKQLAEGKS